MAASASASLRTEVTFRELDPATIEPTSRSGEWRDRAGAYAVQGLGSILVERIAGRFLQRHRTAARSCLLRLAPDLFAEFQRSRNRLKSLT